MFTPSVQRVLGAALSHPERSFTLQELLRLAATGRGSTQQQIDRLVDAGVLIDEPRRGRQRSIRANTSFFLYPELSSIARKSFGLAEPLRNALEPFTDQINEAFLFGSVVKGTDTERSDIDIVVVGAASLLDLTEALQKVEQALGRSVHLSLYDPAEWLTLIKSDPVVAQIHNGPKLILLPHGQAA
ncbi:nucleotidyltransferase domain-containing protein [Aquabacterium sp.]|uniref:nucleotidyltransferase domain-containing protein n=1 Tax=Aquabacterium sp. TaxID=1872578 RepID=UPI002C9BA3D0|nr:nucleotidyltransferase domain-containing protein [Aquabacterium sp.]HSW07955.1 nucleotidyltransferase domain-containing protein [Aquabacterium sp.]